jgi:TolB-like protein
MISTELSVSSFSKDQIHEQLQRIFENPLFAVSAILKRFLLFVTEESLEGRSNQIKEYTIGVNVLHKPTNFNPRQDAIVRIHAGRLRRALNQYYKEAGAHDPILISIPKGSYFPLFSGHGAAAINENEIARIEEISVNGPATVLGDHYMVTGDMQCSEDRLRLTVQMINTETHEEIWNQVVEYKLTNSNSFDVQDDIAKKLIAAVGDYYRLIMQNAAPASIMAVA